jgi:hypothetical protein
VLRGPSIGLARGAQWLTGSGEMEQRRMRARLQGGNGDGDKASALSTA